MLHAEVRVDLPSALPEPPGTVRRLVDFVFGRVGRPSERLQEVLLDGLTIVEGLIQSFARVGFDDVVCVTVDGAPVYVDTHQKLADLSDALEGVVRTGSIDKGFAVMRIVFCLVRGDSRVLGEVRLEPRVPERSEEIEIRLSGRNEAMLVRPDEGPREFAARVRAYLRDAGHVEAELDRLDDLATSLGEALEGTFAGATVRRVPARATVIALGARQVGRMRFLGFRAGYRPVVYRSIPEFERIGAYDDPMVRHYYSPYEDLFHWIALGEILSGEWSSPRVDVVHPSGRLLFRSQLAYTYDPGRLEVARDAVRVSDRGDLVIAGAVPRIDGLDPVEWGSPHSPGWAGEGWDPGGET